MAFEDDRKWLQEDSIPETDGSTSRSFTIALSEVYAIGILVLISTLFLTTLGPIHHMHPYYCHFLSYLTPGAKRFISQFKN